MCIRDSVWFALMLLAWGASRIKPWSTGGTWLLIFSMSGFLGTRHIRPVSDAEGVPGLLRRRAVSYTHLQGGEINDLVDRTVGRDSTTEFLYKGRGSKDAR